MQVFSYIHAFLRLIRIGNLIFIILAQCLFYFCIVNVAYQLEYRLNGILTQSQFYLLVIASVLIAAGGYVINDYFDLNIDRINKPDKLVVERFMKRRWAIVWHIVFSFTGLVISFILSIQLSNIYIGIGNTIAVILLFLYSVSFKKQLIIGNVIISLLTAWVIMVLFIAELPTMLTPRYAQSDRVLMRIFRLSIVYSSFAFITTLIREILKDMEDEVGDRKYGCKTMPIVWGLHTTKIFTGVWLFILICIFLGFFFYILFYRWYTLALSILIWFIPMLIIVIRKLSIASSSKQFHSLSFYMKTFMLTGMITMVFYYYYNT